MSIVVVIIIAFVLTMIFTSNKEDRESRKDMKEFHKELDKQIAQGPPPELISQYRENINSQNNLQSAKNAFDSENYTDAIKYANNVLMNDKHETNALYIKAVASMDKGIRLENKRLIADSISYFDEVLVQNSNSHISDAWYNKGLALTHLQNFSEASQCMSKVVELKPYDEEAWVHKMVVEYMLQNYSTTIKCINKVFEINPYNEHAKKMMQELKENNLF